MVWLSLVLMFNHIRQQLSSILLVSVCIRVISLKAYSDELACSDWLFSFAYGLSEISGIKGPLRHHMLTRLNTQIALMFFSFFLDQFINVTQVNY